jgi:hypothetical protein
VLPKLRVHICPCSRECGWFKHIVCKRTNRTCPRVSCRLHHCLALCGIPVPVPIMHQYKQETSPGSNILESPGPWCTHARLDTSLHASEARRQACCASGPHRYCHPACDREPLLIQTVAHLFRPFRRSERCKLSLPAPCRDERPRDKSRERASGEKDQDRQHPPLKHGRPIGSPLLQVYVGELAGEFLHGSVVGRAQRLLELCYATSPTR